MNVRIIPLTLLVLVGTLGCVSSGKYGELEAERDALAGERDALVSERNALASERETLSSELESVRAENREMKSTYGELVQELQSEVEAGQITIQQVVDGIRLGVSDELLFSSGAASLDGEAIALLERVAKQIADEDAIVSVEGHTDDVPLGPTLKKRYPTNWELGGARAALVVRALSDSGVDPARLRAVSRGPFAPLVPNDSPENRARNRRTEIILRAMPKG